MSLVRWKPRSLAPWSPRQDLSPLADDWSRLFDEFFDLAPATRCDWCPAADVQEEEDRYVVTVDLPGMTKDAVEVTFENDVLTISGERKSESEQSNGKLHRNERFFGKFTRSLRFPSDASREQIQATFKDGVLKIALPKSEEAKVRRIEVS